ncbi:G2/mitotic-specific cyclin-4 [Paramyrothecium foliicola]|nr:G2/mitotic-specific cyclin-4 [Paramyrothecium foliicola]
MDARPYRPRGAENAIPSLHQRHKSTGNLLGMDSNAATGFRGPARRAAFGDVTNQVRNVGNARDDGKTTKSYMSAGQHAGISVNILKENMPLGKDALARPAQRLPGLSTKPKAETTSKPLREVQPAPAERGRDAELGGVALRNVASNSKLAPLRQERAVEAPSLQPRHHKSQPQLKQQRPLVDFQENFLETSIRGAPVLPAVIEAEPALDLARQVLESVDHIGLSNVPMAGLAPLAEVCANVNHIEEPSLVRVNPLLPLHGDAIHASVNLKDNTAPTLSEPEEYWDEEEDEEDYDDQDQAYTTAHSFRSRDITTGGVTTLLVPKFTSRVHRELEEARVDTEKHRTQEDIMDEIWDVSMVAEYGDDINDYMRELEIRMLPNPHYMDSQTEIQWSMRSVLMDWLVQVHGRFGLLPETLFLTVNYIDRFLTSKIVSIGKLQLAGATALLIAAKYEEINCPSLQDIVYMVDGSYTAEEILKAERYMLSMLNFELGWPGPMSFLRRVSKADDYDLETRTLAKYFLELTIMDERFVASPPSYLAAGAHCLSRMILQKGIWTKAHAHWSGYTWTQLKPLVTMLLECCEEPRLHHAAIFDKYSEKRFKEASTIVQECLDAGFMLPHNPAPPRRLSTQALGSDYTNESLERPHAPLVPIEG